MVSVFVPCLVVVALEFASVGICCCGAAYCVGCLVREVWVDCVLLRSVSGLCLI